MRVLNTLAAAFFVWSAFAYDTAPIPLWVGALDLCICVLFLAQLVPPVEATE